MVMSPTTIRKWGWAHKWSSLICTVFLLMLCLTGLPLIFEDEIEQALNPTSWQPASQSNQSLALDDIVKIAQQNKPSNVPIFMSFDTDRPVVNVTTGPTVNAPGTAMHFASFDRTNGDLVPTEDRGAAVMEFILQLHTDMFLGLTGMLFLGGMGILIVISVVSGVVLYAPFMRRLTFGTIRRPQSRRTLWLDYHNLLGITSMAWVLVVAITGVINTLEQPIIDTWRDNNLTQLLEKHEQTQIAQPTSSLDAAVNAALTLATNQTLQFVAFPGSSFSTKAHYAIYFHGNTPVTERMITPVLVHAESGSVEGLQPMPWYVKTLSLSRPLHFGDYAGLTLKIIWAMLDIITIAVLISGLYLWWSKKSLKSSTTGKVSYAN